MAGFQAGLRPLDYTTCKADSGIAIVAGTHACTKNTPYASRQSQMQRVNIALLMCMWALDSAGRHLLCQVTPCLLSTCYRRQVNRYQCTRDQAFRGTVRLVIFDVQQCATSHMYSKMHTQGPEGFSHVCIRSSPVRLCTYYSKERVLDISCGGYLCFVVMVYVQQVTTAEVLVHELVLLNCRCACSSVLFGLQPL
jgi:hypothetical protein